MAQLPMQPQVTFYIFSAYYHSHLLQASAAGTTVGGGGSGASSVASAPSNDPLRNLSILSQEAGMNAGASAV